MIAFEPRNPDFARNPYPFYRELRESEPLHFSDVLRGWIVTRYDDYLALVRDPRFSPDIRQWEHYEPPTHPALLRLQRVEDAGMFTMDAANHTRIRSLVSRAFTPRAVQRLIPVMEAIVDECLDRALPTGRIDLVRDLADIYPTYVISRMLGIPSDSDRERRFKELADVIIGLASPMVTTEERIAAAPDREEMLALVGEVVEEHRRAPQDEMLSALIAVEEEGERLSTAELLSLVPGLILAGSETTANSISLGVADLLRHPEQRKLFQERPSLRRAAVDELLRFDMPGYGITRYAREDVELRGCKVRAGQLVLLSIPAAHRDPEVFPDPDRLDFERDTSRIAVFGNGLHFCLGAQLARLELLTGYTRILERLEEPRLACSPDEIPFRVNSAIRGPASLPIEFNA